MTDTALYVHWPICRSKCPYCDFNSHVLEDFSQHAYASAIAAELDAARAEMPDARIVSVFFGGGTPSLMQPDIVGGIIDGIAARFCIAEDIEITAEANPGSFSDGWAAGVRAAGVNRISLGVQSLDDRSLKKLGRRHDAATARRAVETAANLFSRVSFDLISARPDQTLSGFAAELSGALDLAQRLDIGHLSIYELTIEPETRYFEMQREGRFRPLDDDTAADIYRLTGEMTAAAGLPAYEISNHAAPGAVCRHNLHVWRGGPYIGIGPGAHGRIRLPDGTICATRQIRDPGVWLTACRTQGQGRAETAPVPPAERDIERLLLGLRLAEGLAVESLSDPACLDPDALARMRARGLMTDEPGRLRLTTGGRLFLDGILADIVQADAAAVRETA